MSDFDDFMTSAGLVWIFSLIISGLGYLIVGIFFFLVIIAVVGKAVYVCVKEIRENWPKQSSDQTK